MLCQKCGIRKACCIVTSCDGIECYELHLCLECKEGGGGFPTPAEQKQIVASAMEGARAKGLDEEIISEAIGIEAEELRRILRGEGVRDPAVWQIIIKHLRTDE
ncbi:MAG: hypothetical protein AMJ79_05275 [Phycisphaerae bacterium SM23_30]|nr:MAG: hypothetical protein AMJ79_05275 [Phycisphaerae bacterium SM23_30]